MNLSSESNFDGLHGSVLFCQDCARPTVHFRAMVGLPVCGFCGATPARPGAPDDSWVEEVRTGISLASN
jgi:ribosomal protein L37AE/L43A